MNENTEILSPQVDESIYYEPYIVKDGCLFEQMCIKEQLVDNRLADFVPVLKAVVTYDDGIEQKKLFRVSAVYKTGLVLSEQTVSAEEMQSMKWLLQRWGQYGAVVPKQNVLSKICHAIMLTKTPVSNETVYSQTGWRKLGGEYVFLMPNENGAHTVELQGKLKRYCFDKTCEKDDFIFLSAMLEDSFAPQSVLLPLLAETFLCPLNHFLKAGGCEPKYLIALIGRTGSRKSSLSALFLSFFGLFTASELPMSFYDTPNSILANVYYLKDVLTCIDDFHPAGAYKEQVMRETAQSISRFFGDRIGKGRLNARSELQPSRPPMCNAIITSETSLGLCESGEARYFNIEIGENDINLSEFSEYQRLARQNVLSGMMMRYVDWIKQKYLCDEESFVKTLAEKFESYREMFIRKVSALKIRTHSRVPDMLAHLNIGFEYLLEFLVDCEALGADDMKKYIEVFDVLLINNSAVNSENIVSENPVNIFCEKLKSLLDSGRCYAEVRGASGIPRQKNCIGLQDDEYYYLFMDAAHSEVRKLCGEMGESFSIKKNELLKQLRKEGVLISKSSRNTVSIRENSNSVVNVAVLSKRKIEERL